MWFLKKVLVINGPNLNLLGNRETGLYGTTTLTEIEQTLKDKATQAGVQIEFFQSNHEGAILDCLHDAVGKIDCIIINAGALTHYSIALHDALRILSCPIIEVHLTNIYQREDFRHKSYVSYAATGGIFGLGPFGYELALDAALRLMEQND